METKSLSVQIAHIENGCYSCEYREGFKCTENGGRDVFWHYIIDECPFKVVSNEVLIKGKAK